MKEQNLKNLKEPGTLHFHIIGDLISSLEKIYHTVNDSSVIVDYLL